MGGSFIRIAVAGSILIAAFFIVRPIRPLSSTVLAGKSRENPLRDIVIDYPQQGSVFPPEITAPTFLWHDASEGSDHWRIETIPGDGSTGRSFESPGDRLRIGEIDSRCVSNTNELPKLTPEQASARAWKPEAGEWQWMKLHSGAGPMTVRITGFKDRQAVSQGGVAFTTSQDPVGAPIFYRDVPLMPSELKKGVIKPLAQNILPYVAWRLRNIGESESRLLMEGIHTCANCHSFSADGKTMGMDLDGPENDKGLYAIVRVAESMSIRKEDVISWSAFRGETSREKRLAFMSQVSPDGRFVVTTTQVEYYVANFKDYRFLQVFYPTRGILAWYDRTAGSMKALPGADDPRFVQANAAWSPDGKTLVFLKAPAQAPYPEGRKTAEYAGDPNEVPVQYDLYRIPFDEGRGGRAEPVQGAAQNGMSNSFPKISPDGKWIVFVKSRNGQLMRPDGQLYIVPASGGSARRMRCNTPRMNSWHSFSPNGRWMVFSSKSRSPYTQMFLTHIDENGNDSPGILLENSTAANRAVNIPEFVNIPVSGISSIVAPAADFYRLYNQAWELTQKGEVDSAIIAWTKALALDPEDAKALNNYGALLLREGRLEEAIVSLKRALALSPDLPRASDNLGLAMVRAGNPDAALPYFQKALELNPDSTEALVNLGGALLQLGRHREALAVLRTALSLAPDQAVILGNMAWILAASPDTSIRNASEAVALAEKAVALSGGKDPTILENLATAYAAAGRFPEAVAAIEKALSAASGQGDDKLASELKNRLALYQSKRKSHD